MTDQDKPAAVVPGTREALVTALRKLAVRQGVRLTYGGGDVPNGGRCVLCKAEWDEPFKDNEWHNSSCILFPAPVPPADGALNNELGSSERLGPRYDGTRSINSSSTERREPREGVAAGETASPSGTGAAEPVAWPPYIELPLTFWYKNHRGEESLRTAFPIGIRFVTTEWHPEAQWLLKAFDRDKQAEREFAMRDMLALPPVRGDREAIWPLNDRQLWEASCITRAQLESWSDESISNHAAGMRHTVKFLMQLLDELSLPVQSSAPVDPCPTCGINRASPFPCECCTSAVLSSAPEATVSGEAVAWLVLSEHLDDLGNEKVRIWWRDKERADAWCAQHNATPIALYASPQDVGREATIEECKALALAQRSHPGGAWIERIAFFNIACEAIAEKIGSLFRKGGKQPSPVYDQTSPP